MMAKSHRLQILLCIVGEYSGYRVGDTGFVSAVGLLIVLMLSAVAW